MAKLDLPNLIATLPLLAGLPSEDLHTLLEGCREIRVRSGNLLVERGAPGDGFFIIVVGRLKLSIPSASGHEKVVEMLGPKQSFGEAITLLGETFFMSAQALEDTLVLHFSREAVLNVCARSAAFNNRLLLDMSQRWLTVMRDLKAFSLQSAAERVVSFLLECPIDNSSGELRIELPANKNLIASRLNLKPETLSRVFAKLALAGLIRVDGRLVYIRDLPSLREYEDSHH